MAKLCFTCRNAKLREGVITRSQINQHPRDAVGRCPFKTVYVGSSPPSEKKCYKRRKANFLKVKS